MYVYIQSEAELWTVGFYAPNGNWIPEADYESEEDAANRVAFLNGGVVEVALVNERFRPEPMDPSRLAHLMLDWEDAQQYADKLRSQIEEQIELLGESVTVGNVRARYSRGRKSYDYEAACKDATPEQVEKYTKIRKSVTWRDLALYGLELDQDSIPFSQSDPSVSVKLLD
jgi:hypothetical protein